MKVTQLCPTLCDPIEYTVHGILQARILEQGFPCGLADKEYACNAGDLGSIPGLGRSPGKGKGYPLQYSGLGCKELDMTEQLSLFILYILWVWTTV